MTVAELIVKLRALPDQTLPVLLDDWNEGYAFPAELDSVDVCSTMIWPDNEEKKEVNAVLLGVKE